MKYTSVTCFFRDSYTKTEKYLIYDLVRFTPRNLDGFHAGFV